MVLLLLVAIVVFAYFPIPSYSAQGHFWEPVLNIKSDWIYLVIVLAFFIVSYTISKLNSVMRPGYLNVNDQFLELNFNNKTYQLRVSDLDYLEFTGGDKLYFRSARKPFNITLTGNNKEALRRLNILLYKMSNQTEVVIRD